jgi:hypothetical protein
MLKSILKLGAATLLAAAIAGAPAQLFAQTTNQPAAEKKTTAPTEKKTKKDSAAKKDAAAKQKSAHPFHGKLAEVDKVAKTIKLGQSVYQVTSATKITKSGKPATLEDGEVGEKVSGYAKPAEDGKMVATTVNFGGKSEDKGGEKKKEKQPAPAKQ